MKQEEELTKRKIRISSSFSSKLLLYCLAQNHNKSRKMQKQNYAKKQPQQPANKFLSNEEEASMYVYSKER